jgi:hypothetical protein
MATQLSAPPARHDLVGQPDILQLGPEMPKMQDANLKQEPERKVTPPEVGGLSWGDP